MATTARDAATHQKPIRTHQTTALPLMETILDVQLWAIETYALCEENKDVLRQYNQEMVDKYEAELLVHDIKGEL